MRCLNCGKYNIEGHLTREGEVCKYCGGGLVSDKEFKKIVNKKINEKINGKKDPWKSSGKQKIGFWLTFFLGVLGWAIGFLIYQYSEEKDSFFAGVAKAVIVNFIITGIASIIIGLIFNVL